MLISPSEWCTCLDHNQSLLCSETYTSRSPAIFLPKLIFFFSLQDFSVHWMLGPVLPDPGCGMSGVPHIGNCHSPCALALFRGKTETVPTTFEKPLHSVYVIIFRACSLICTSCQSCSCCTSSASCFMSTRAVVDLHKELLEETHISR